MAGETIRTQTLYKALRLIAQTANRCEERADAWLKEYGMNDLNARTEQVRAEAYREVIHQLCNILDLDQAEVLPALRRD
jgi:cystathionine beta-lyase/cystathionine gamma-synthase